VPRALKILVATLLALGLVPFALLYGLYILGARDIPADWGPTTASFPPSARLALWRSYGGQGEPERDPVSPPGYAWRLYRAPDDMERRHWPDPGITMANQAARAAGLAAHGGRNRLLVEIAATIRASHWPVASQLDTVLASAYFGGETHGLRDGAMRLYGRPLESLDEAQLHVLVAMMAGPRYFDPWCHHDRLRERVFATAPKWNVPTSAQQLEAALAAIGPRPADDRCDER
jgi:hypothetical protein